MVRTRAQSRVSSENLESSGSSLDSTYRVNATDDTVDERAGDYSGEVPETIEESRHSTAEIRVGQQNPVRAVVRAEQAPLRPQHQYGLERFMKLKPPVFKGEPDSVVAERWLAQMVKLFAAAGCEDRDKLAFAIFRMEEDAEFWWKTIELKWTRDRTLRTWDNFVAEFEQQYIPPSVRDRREVDFIELEQGSMSVSQYAAQFNRLSRHCSYLVSTEERKAKRFVKGLIPSLQSALVSSGIKTFGSMQERALEIESYQEGRKGKEVKVSSVSERTDSKKRKWIEQQQAQDVPQQQIEIQEGEKDIPRRKCSFCNKGNHTEDNCWVKSGSCLRCGKDHKTRDCPKWEDNQKGQGKRPAA